MKSQIRGVSARVLVAGKRFSERNAARQQMCPNLHLIRLLRLLETDLQDLHPSRHPLRHVPESSLQLIEQPEQLPALLWGQILGMLGDKELDVEGGGVELRFGVSEGLLQLLNGEEKDLSGNVILCCTALDARTGSGTHALSPEYIQEIPNASKSALGIKVMAPHHGNFSVLPSSASLRDGSECGCRAPGALKVTQSCHQPSPVHGDSTCHQQSLRSPDLNAKVLPANGDAELTQS